MSAGGRIFVAFLVSMALLLVAGCGEPPESEYDRYRDACHDFGGFISREDHGWTAVHFNCVGQTSGVPLPELKR